MSNTDPSSLSEQDEKLSPLTNKQLKEEQSALEAEMAQLKLFMLREEVSTVKRKRADRLAELNSRLQASKNEVAQREYLRNHQCTHKKGGRGHNAVLGGQGTDANYAVIHHMLPTGRHMIYCQRCGDEQYSQDPLTGEPETTKYQEFRRFPTDNTASGSTLFLPTRQYARSV